MELAAVAKYIGGALAVFPLFGVGMALGNIFSTLIASVGRNPGARDKVFPLAILGFAMTEAIALFALLISFLILFA